MESRLKLKNGQAGPDGNTFLRDKRVEIRVCQQEYEKLEKYALEAGYLNVAQYLRESGLTRKQITSPSTKQKEKNQWLYEINRIGNNVNQIARHLNQGKVPDEEILMVLLQIQDIAQDTLKEALKSKNEDII
ncbi:MAG: MobC family plasmid mobilization relaxosome protein [Methylotenera sp.]|nr:MobC family plasmid mobilization relaxosome protein [Methylotenera sp.]